MARTSRDVMLASKRLSSLLENGDLTAGATFDSVIKRLKNKLLKVNFSLDGIQTRKFEQE